MQTKYFPPTDRPCVVKVGGSLFDLPDLPVRLQSWLTEYPRTVLLAGGGAAANAIRQATHLFSLSEVDAHWLAIHAMSLQADLLARMLSLPLVETVNACPKEVEQPLVFDAHTLLRADNARTVPVGWHVTSDSIAALLAHSLGIEDVVLLKSIGETGMSWRDAACKDWVDSYFPTAVSGLSIWWVNFRSFHPSGS